MSFAKPERATAVAPALRLGLRARMRAAREARLICEPRRRKLAQAIESAVARAATPHAPLSAAVPIAREAAGEARGALLDLAERLRSPRPVDLDGMLLARTLLVDGGGPLYVPQEPGELRAAALRALDALDGRNGVR